MFSYFYRTKKLLKIKEQFKSRYLSYKMARNLRLKIIKRWRGVVDDVRTIIQKKEATIYIPNIY